MLMIMMLPVVYRCLLRKLRCNRHGQILIHMCCSLLGLYTMFLVSSFLGEFYVDISPTLRNPFCIASSALVHYFMLVYLLITVAQSILVYLDLVVVIYSRDILKNYQLKVGIISWSKFQGWRKGKRGGAAHTCCKKMRQLYPSTHTRSKC